MSLRESITALARGRPHTAGRSQVRPQGLPTDGAGDQERSRTRRLLAWVCAAVVACRLVYAWQPLRNDEGGYLLIARHWSPRGGEFLYGDYHVDRPFLLMDIYRVAATWQWDGAIRVLAIPFVLAAVLGLARAGFLLAGWSGARWSTVVAAALLNSPALGADQADGEVLAVPFVVLSVALTLQAWRTPSPSTHQLLALGAGACAASACMVKQSFLDAFVFAAVLVGAELVRRRASAHRCRRLATGFLVGALALTAGMGARASVQGLSLRSFWTDVVGFRAAALSVLLDAHTDAPLSRAAMLGLLAMVSMLLPIAWVWVRWVAVRLPAVTSAEWAVTALLLFEVAAMAAGGSYWPQYLVQVVPAIALAAAIVAPRTDATGAQMRRLVLAAGASAVFCIVCLTVVYATVPQVWWQARTGQWLKASADTGDTAVVTYGHASVLEYADLRSPYPYLWSLPMRTLDPRHDTLTDVLSSRNAPAWIVEVNGLGAWGFDHDGQLSALVRARYDEVAKVCGHSVLLRADLDRELAPLPRC